MTDKPENQNEQAMTVSPEMGFDVLKNAKAAVYEAFKDQGDSPASAVSTAIVGYGNAMNRIAALEAELAAEQKIVWTYREKNQNTLKAFESIRSSLGLSDPPAIVDIEEEAAVITTGIAALEAEVERLREFKANIEQAVNGTTYRVIDGELFEIRDGVPDTIPTHGSKIAAEEGRDE